MFRECYTTVSDLSLCQRCPALFGYKVHRHEGDAWREGIKGKGFYYGSMFHKNIARVFFEAASDPTHPLHDALARTVSGGHTELEDFVRENIFMPFVGRRSRHYTSGQIMAAAEGVTVWVRAMHEFFAEIPSLTRHPERAMSTVFLAPEQKLQAAYDFPDRYGRLIVTGCYDALMFNPDKSEARLFEFKGCSKTDAVVPLSQSVIYAWLIENFSGIVPSVEIIYLDEEDRKPDIFSPESVKGMIISGLPGLFYAAFNTIALRRLPEVMKDKEFCGECRFRSDCASDWAMKFRKRKAASMVNVLVFMVASMLITTHVFFFSTMSAETNALQVKAMQNRFRFDRALDVVINDLEKENAITVNDEAPVAAFLNYDKVKSLSGDGKITIVRPSGKNRDTRNNLGVITSGVSYDVYEDYKGFHEEDSHDYYAKINGQPERQATVTRAKYDFADNIQAFVYDLNYTYIDDYTMSIPGQNWTLRDRHERVFPPMRKSTDKRYFLIRVYRLPSDTAQKKHMYQVLVKRTRSSSPEKYYDVEPLSFQEVWY